MFQEHSEQLLGYCLRRRGSRAEAEDAVQTTFLYAVRALARGAVPECEPAWLHAIAKNVCRSQHRADVRRGPVAGEVDLDSLRGREPDDEAELLVGLREALGSIPERQQQALVLREWQGLPPREIATQLGMTAPATHALLTRARHSLAAALMSPRRPVLGLASLLFELRSYVKALLGGASAKAAVATVAVVGVGVGGVVADKGLGKEPGAPQAPTPAGERRAADTGVGRTSSSLVVRPKADRVARQVSRRSSVPTRPAAAVAPGTGPVDVFIPRAQPRSDPASDPRGDQDTRPGSTPKEEPTGVVPLDPLELPKVELPTDLLPPLELPPVLPVPDVPPVELPPVDPPPVPSLPLP